MPQFKTEDEKLVVCGTLTFTNLEKKIVLKAAEMRGMPLKTFVRKSSLSIAKKIIGQGELAKIEEQYEEKRLMNQDADEVDDENLESKSMEI